VADGAGGPTREGKKELRREARARVGALTGEERQRSGERVAVLLRAMPEFAEAATVLTFATLPGEVPTGPLARIARAMGARLVYPRCLPHGMEMSLHRVDSDEDLAPAGRYGILEPAGTCPAVTVADIDFAVVPGLAWDRNGNRLGRGAGYYDRLLGDPGWRGFRCGLFFAAQEFPELPADPWDIPLDAVVTEREIWRPRPGGRG
jgi:5-formyltetrahydrofolate cyclo-ligase